MIFHPPNYYWLSQTDMMRRGTWSLDLALHWCSDVEPVPQNPYLGSRTVFNTTRNGGGQRGDSPPSCEQRQIGGEYEWSPLVITPLLVWTHCVNAPQIFCRFEACGWTARCSVTYRWRSCVRTTVSADFTETSLQTRLLPAPSICNSPQSWSAIANFGNTEIKDDVYQDRRCNLRKARSYIFTTRWRFCVCS
jgi:hypothetical protein